MTKKAVAAFFSGYGIAFTAGWILRDTYGPKSVYAAAALAIISIIVSYAIDKSRTND